MLSIYKFSALLHHDDWQAYLDKYVYRVGNVDVFFCFIYNDDIPIFCINRNS